MFENNSLLSDLLDFITGILADEKTIVDDL
jgi:hypothetical protein